MRNSIIALFCNFLFLHTFAQETILRNGMASSLKVSSGRLQNVDKLLQEQVEGGLISGAVGLVAKEGKIIYYKAFGLDDTDRKTPHK